MSRGIYVLIVDDNPADVDLTRESLAMTDFDVELTVAVDGIDALAQLEQRVASGGELPDLILLDLNLPRKGGHEVLLEIRSVGETRHIPVVVLSSSEAPADIVESYRLGASCYVSKPVDFKAFCRSVESICHFWFRVARLPEGGPAAIA